MSPEVQAKIAAWRAKAAANTLTPEEMAEAIKILRADRLGAAIASDKSRRSKAKAEVPDAEDLLAELGVSS